MICGSCQREVSAESRLCPHCGWRVDAAPVKQPPRSIPSTGFEGSGLEVGQQFAQFRIEKSLREGDLGEAWLAYDAESDGRVVIHVLPPVLQRDGQAMRAVKYAFKRIRGLRHPNICCVRDLLQHEPAGYCVVLDDVPGERLAVLLRRLRVFELTSAVNLLRPVAAALDYAHGMHIANQRVTPDNILVEGPLTSPKSVKLLDFGLAAAIRALMARLSNDRPDVADAQHYLAPEQWKRRHQNGRTDQYALAVVAYELLAGRRPFETNDVSILRTCALTEAPAPIERLSAHANEALASALSKKYDERFDSCSAFVEALSAPPPADAADNRAAELLHRGIAYCNQKKLPSAFADFYAVIRAPESTADMRATAYLYRGLGRSQKRPMEGHDEFTSALNVPGANAEIRARAHLGRALARADWNRPDKAVVDFSAAIDSPEAPKDVLLDALNGRGISHTVLNNDEAAIADFSRVIGMSETPDEMRVDALYNRGLAHERQNDPDRAAADFLAVIDAPRDLPPQAILDLGAALANQNKARQADAAFRALANTPNASPEIRAKALCQRAAALKPGLPVRQNPYLDAVIDMPDAPGEIRASLLLERGKHFITQNDELALADLGAALEMPGANATTRGRALIERAWAHRFAERLESMMADYASVINMPDVPDDVRTEALFRRGWAHERAMRPDLALTDYLAAINAADAPGGAEAGEILEQGAKFLSQDKYFAAHSAFHAVANMSDASADFKAKALCFQGNYDAAINMSEASAETQADALMQRALLHIKRCNERAAIADLTTVIDMPEISRETLASALLERGQHVGYRMGLADFTSAVDLPGVSAETHAKALLSRASKIIAVAAIKRNAAVLADLEAAIDTPGISAETRAKAVCKRGSAYARWCDDDLAIADFESVINMQDAPEQIRETAKRARERLII